MFSRGKTFPISGTRTRAMAECSPLNRVRPRFIIDYFRSKQSRLRQHKCKFVVQSSKVGQAFRRNNPSKSPEILHKRRTYPYVKKWARRFWKGASHVFLDFFHNLEILGTLPRVSLKVRAKSDASVFSPDIHLTLSYFYTYILRNYIYVYIYFFAIQKIYVAKCISFQELLKKKHHDNNSHDTTRCCQFHSAEIHRTQRRSESHHEARPEQSTTQPEVGILHQTILISIFSTYLR